MGNTTVKDVKLTSNVDAVLKATDEAIEKALITIGIEAQSNVSTRAAVVTGRLAASINYATRTQKGSQNRSYLRQGNKAKESDSSPRGTPDKHTVVVGTNVEYAKIREYGPGRSPHYIRRGLQENANQYKNILIEELKGN